MICTWREDMDGQWDTECGEYMDGDLEPPYAYINFCAICGRAAEFVPYMEDDE
jgi:hypothetical protein